MEFNIFIVESRSKVKTISNILSKSNSFNNNKWKVIATNGHIAHFENFDFLQINALQNNDDENIEIIMKYFKPISKNTFFKEFRSLLKEPYKNIFIGTDADREGEIIAFSIVHFFHLKQYYRCIFNEINSTMLTSITQSIDRTSKINISMVKSALTRTVIDYSIGFLISPYVSKHISSFKNGEGLSAGRCQSVALKLIYEKNKDTVLVEPSNSNIYNIYGNFFDYSFQLMRKSTSNIETSKFTKDEILYFIDKPVFFWESINENITYKSPPLPFNTSQLIIKAHSILSYSPRYTMERAQALFTKGRITYIRTESTLISTLFIQQTIEYIRRTYGDNFISKDYTNITNKYENKMNESTSFPHEAIRPTNIMDIPMIDDDPLYKIIWENTIKACMPPASFRTFEIIINTHIDNFIFKKRFENVLFRGWMTAFTTVKDEIQSNILLYFNSLKKNSKVTCKKIQADMTIQTPNKYYTESGIIKKLEELNIGRPSTYSLFTDILISRGYIKKEDIQGITLECDNYTIKFIESELPILEVKKEVKTFGKEKGKLVIQPLGIACIEFLIKYFEDLFRYDYTADMEKSLDLISNNENENENEWTNIIKKIYGEIKELTSSLPKIGKFKYQIDEFNEFVFVKNEPCIRKKIITDKENNNLSTESTNKKKSTKKTIKYEYYPIKKSIKLDIESLKNGLYKLEDLVEYLDSNIGYYKETPLRIKTGQYGHYLEWGVEPNIYSKSLEEYKDSLFHLTEEKAILFIEEEMKNLENDMDNKKIFRILDPFTSVRQSKYGTYVYHKTEEMKKPKFISLKKCKIDYMNAPVEELMKWIYEKKDENYIPHKKKFYFKS